MTNQDLIRQYVDTGLSIPEYQYNKLSNNLKRTYERKRLIMLETTDGTFQPYEMNFLPNEIKGIYGRHALFLLGDPYQHGDIPDKLVAFLDPDYQRYFLKLETNNGYYSIGKGAFEALYEENKLWYAKMRIRRHNFKEHEFMKNMATDETAPYYLQAFRTLGDEN